MAKPDFDEASAVAPYPCTIAQALELRLRDNATTKAVPMGRNRQFFRPD